MNYPEIRFKNPWLLMDMIRSDISHAYSDPDELYKLEPKYIDDALARFEPEWRKHEKKIVEGICDIFDREFKQNVIDIYVAPFYNSFSDPMVIAAKCRTERVVEVIAHELLHRLLTDNTQDGWVLDHWKEQFGDEHDFVTLVHIPVHAGLEALFRDVLNEPKRLDRDKKMCALYPSYQKAWEYVEEHGYKVIIEQVRATKKP